MPKTKKNKKAVTPPRARNLVREKVPSDNEAPVALPLRVMSPPLPRELDHYIALADIALNAPSKKK